MPKRGHHGAQDVHWYSVACVRMNVCAEKQICCLGQGVRVYAAVRHLDRRQANAAERSDDLLHDEWACTRRRNSPTRDRKRITRLSEPMAIVRLTACATETHIRRCVRLHGSGALNNIR